MLTLYATCFVTLTPKSEEMKGTLKLDATKKPKEIDLNVTQGGKKGVALGIYSLEGDTLKLTMAQPGETERPTDLSSKKGAKHVFVTLERRKK